jgi:hypothetical protein
LGNERIVLAAESASAVGGSGGGGCGVDDKRVHLRGEPLALEMNSNSKHNRAQRDKWLSIKGLMLLALL